VLRIIDVALKRNGEQLFEHLDVTVHAGQRVAIVGRNGVGKSTLFQLLLGTLQPERGDVEVPRDWQVAHMAQEVAVTRRCALDYVIDGHRALRRAEARLADAEARGDDMAIATAHGELDDLGVYQAPARAGEILGGLGFDGPDQTKPFADFSGGWRIRLNLARALMAPADLLLLDEPTNHLDLEATLWLETWLQRFPGTLLVIAHDRAFLDNVAQVTVHLHQGGATTYRGNYSAFERQRAEALTLQQARHAKQQREIAHIQQFVTRFRAKASKARQAQSRMKALERMEAVAPVHVDSPYRIVLPQPEAMSTPLLSLNHASIGYGEKAVLHDVHETILPGARIGVLGNNGAGKSTLLKCLVGSLQPLAGERVSGAHAQIGYFAQHQLELLDPGRTALAALRSIREADGEQRCRDYLGGWGFPKEKLERPVATLSGGEKARLVLALLAARRPALLVLDEPTNHLDLDMRDALAMALQDYEGALVIVAHDRSLLERTVDEYWLVEGGTVTRLSGDLDQYAATHNPAALQKPSEDRSTPAGRKAERRAAAAERRREQPLRDSVSRLEKEIDQLSQSLAKVEGRLADPETYHNLAAPELDELLQQAARLRAKRDAAEARWLTDAEALEALREAVRD
jgi:ATP-binding cassette subfamily F protein 3